MPANAALRPTSVNETVRSRRPREYLTEREIEKLMEAARGNRWGHRDATAILIAYRHGLLCEQVDDRPAHPANAGIVVIPFVPVNTDVECGNGNRRRQPP
jgi:hypothetical protein